MAAANVKGVRVTRQGVRGFGGHIVERTDPRGGTYYWIAYAPGEHEHDDESDLTVRALGLRLGDAAASRSHPRGDAPQACRAVRRPR